MGLFNSSDKKSPLVIDTSVTINLSACGIGEEVLRALGRRVTVADLVQGELENGEALARNDAAQLRAWIKDCVVEELPLTSADDAIFRSLVSGRAGETLDDGEAATIALALATDGVAVLDERKANRICAERFPSLQIASTADLLLQVEVMTRLGETTVRDAIFQALVGARMRVLPHAVDRIVGLLGPDRARLCRSLPRSAR